jgi:hypothetical protein
LGWVHTITSTNRVDLVKKHGRDMVVDHDLTGTTLPFSLFQIYFNTYVMKNRSFHNENQFYTFLKNKGIKLVDHPVAIKVYGVDTDIFRQDLGKDLKTVSTLFNNVEQNMSPKDMANIDNLVNKLDKLMNPKAGKRK